MPTDIRPCADPKVRDGLAALSEAEDHVMAGDWGAALQAFARARALLRDCAGATPGGLQGLLHNAGQWLALTDANAAAAELWILRARVEAMLGDAAGGETVPCPSLDGDAPVPSGAATGNRTGTP